MAFLETTAGLLIKSRNLDAIGGIVHGFGVRGIEIEAYLGSLCEFVPLLARTDQVHGDRVHRLPQLSKAPAIEGDAFITDMPAVVCCVRTADCVPILIADRRRKAVAAIHAGWRGTCRDVVGAAVRAMQSEFGTNPADCLACIGPCICGGCYEVGEEVADSVRLLDIGDDWRAGSRHVDLRKANEALLVRSGICGGSIEVIPHCTRCDLRFASWRRDRDRRTRQFSFIVINPA